MDNKETKFRWSILAIIIFAAVLFRFIPYVFEGSGFNIAPIGAMALFGGAYFSKKYMAFLFPFLALWVSNIVINNVFLSEYFDGFALFGNWRHYLPLLLVVGLGILIIRKVTVKNVLIGSLSASVLFFLVSNFFVWTEGTMYSMNFTGLIECYVMGLPFFWSTIAGDLFFSALLFGGFELIKDWRPGLAYQKA